MYDFEEKWRVFRFWNRLGLALALGAVPGLILIGPVLQFGDRLLELCAALFAGTCFLCIRKIQTFPCPNCGQTFQNSVMEARPNCLNCGLPRYAPAPLKGTSPEERETSTPGQRAQIAAEFQRRQRVYFRRCKQILVLVPCASVLAALFAKLSHFDVAAFFFITLFGGVIGLWTAATYSIYRCPRCKHVPKGGAYVIFDPESCPACGARFRLS